MCEHESLRRKEIAGVSAAMLLILVILWSIALYYYTPYEIIEGIGVENGYLIVFISGLLGGTSLFFPFPYYLIVATFGAAGLNPFFLGAFTAFGVILGECTSYLVGHGAHSLLPDYFEKMAHGLNKWLIGIPVSAVMIILFFWSSLFPLPNDILLVPLGLIRYPFWRTIIPLGLGSLVFNTVTAFTGYYGWSLLFG